MLLQSQNLKHRTLHKMVDLALGLCLKSVQLEVFWFLQIVFGVLLFLLSKYTIEWPYV